MSKHSLYKIAAILLFAAIAAVVPQFAQAATEAGTTITNTATVTFNVLGVPQTAVPGTTSFVVDRKIDLVVSKKSDIITGPSATTPALVYLVTNQSNTTIRFGLSTQVTVVGYTPTTIKIWLDNSNNGTWAPGNTQYVDPGTFLDVVSGGSITVLVTADAGAATNGQTAGISLIAQAAEPSFAASPNAVITATGGANGINTVETVLADAAGSAIAPALDIAYDGRHSALATFTVNASTVTVNKSSIVYYDGISAFAPTAKAIPGATIEYTVVVKNSAGAAIAQSVSLSDTLPVTLTPKTSWTSTNATGMPACAGAALDTGTGFGCVALSLSGQVYTVSVGNLATNATATILYQADVK